MRRAVPLLCVTLLALAACGSRAEPSSESNAQVDGSPSTREGAPSGSLEQVGTAALPCSEEPSEGDVSDDVPGISDDAIRIGVISDRENPATPLPTVGIDESVKAFVELCNTAGGIHGRELVLESYDSQISNVEEVTRSACRADLFALVGTGSVLDQQGVSTREACGLPEVGAYSATPARGESVDFFQPVPGNAAEQVNIGFCTYLAEQFPEAVTKAAMVYTDIPAAAARAQQTVERCESEAGFDYVVNEGVAYGTTDYSTVVADMRDKGVRYFTMVGTTADALAVLEEVDRQGIELDAVDFSAQSYDRELAEADVADGAYVWINTVPLGEAEDDSAMATYLAAMEAIDAGDLVTSLGVQAFSAALMWAIAVEALGSDLTREALVEELSSIHEWDGGGLHPSTDPGAHALVDCFMYLQVVDGRFQRVHPESGFDCDPSYVHTSDRRYE